MFRYLRHTAYTANVLQQFTIVCPEVFTSVTSLATTKSYKTLRPNLIDKTSTYEN
jgi:hypothetical protein